MYLKVIRILDPIPNIFNNYSPKSLKYADENHLINQYVTLINENLNIYSDSPNTKENTIKNNMFFLENIEKIIIMIISL